ncbi:M67 family metallopeptidase [Thermogemmata fonticola]|jgi:proteasome lid subunit RPN8/RPN11|uniref:M67 family metallopeptidase n=1 Tax=Thermogemmata fonticola TaxID=2755323 RepID=A0A7V8VF60_9BACT|nr:M67 family metallopeptidase [Thermogemmata fonticola]MBA2226894.1 M67 family metallopeptidase [Thermogemmata fonticola]
MNHPFSPDPFPSYPFDQLLVPQGLHFQLIHHARLALPHECCGLLAGRIHRGQAFVTHVFPLGNALASPTAYLTDPRDLLHAFRSLRQLRCDLLAFYHSHPTSPPWPSRRDLEQNTYGSEVLHVIVSLAEEEPEIAAWRLFPASYQAVPYHRLAS